MQSLPKFRNLGRAAFETVWRDMQQLTDSRDDATADQVWFVEHDPVFTLGMNGDPAHLLDPGSIPVVQSDRGGQVTYHGPGQLVIYPLLNLKRRKLSIRGLVSSLEQAVIATLADYSILAQGKREAPGVYVGDTKVASIGLRIRRGASYHGMAVNVNMDLEPFGRINPCGFENLAMTQVSALVPKTTVSGFRRALQPQLENALGGEPAP